MSSEYLRDTFCSPSFKQRLSDAVQLGWVQHTITLTDAGMAAIERMKK